MYRIVFVIFLSLPLYSATMGELVDIALHKSRIVKESNNQIELAELQYKENIARQYGSLDLSADYTHYNIPRTLAPLTPTVISSKTPVTTTKDIYSGGVLYTLPLFTGFAHTEDIAIGSLSKTIAQMRARINKEQLVYNIKSLYLSILSQQKALKAQRSYSKALEKLAALIEEEVNLGKKAPLDLLKVKSDLESSKSREMLFESMANISKASLAALVGIKEIKSISPVSIRITKPRYNLKTLLRDSAELARIRIEDIAIDKAERAVKKSRASKLPQVNLAGYIGKNYGEDETLHTMDDETLWQVGVNVKWNIVDFGRSDLTTQRAKIAKMDAIDRKEQALLDLQKSVIEGMENAKLQYQVYHQYLAQYQLLRKSEEIEQVRYDNGVSTINDLLALKGQTQILRAQLIQSRYDYQKSIYFIRYIMESGVKND